LNNAIKHDGYVSAELAKEFPRWKRGKKLEKMEPAYERLKRHVAPYIFRFSERMRLLFK
jgi:hypothetical protein